MQIERQVTYYKATKSRKETKSKALNALTTMLLGKCFLCWVSQGNLVPRHVEMLWIQCRGPQGKGFMEMGNDCPFKKKIKLPQYKFCWRCHLPQDQFMPPSHPSLQLGERGIKNCPHKDLVVLSVMFICQNNKWWRRAFKAFGIVLNMGEHELVV